MKQFSKFLKEATTSQASMQAAKLNLKSDGHGGWLDTRGSFVAKTEDGKLKFVGKKGKKAEDETGKRDAKRPDAVQSKVKSQPQVDPSKKSKVTDQEKGSSTGSGGALTVAFGRFNPPTVGHEKLLSAAKKAAVGGDLKIYPSRTQDPKKNPLDPDMKVSYMKKMFPDYEEQIINDPDMRSIFNVLITANEEGVSDINIIVGSDRQAEFENLATKYNGELYNFDNIRVISAGVRDADAEGVEGMSASKMRKAVMDGDFEAFRKGTPKNLDDGDTKALFDAVRTGMKIKKSISQSASDAKSRAKEKEDKIRARIPNEKKFKASAATAKVKEGFDLWEIAPSLDQKALREQYVMKKIFRIGDIVESLNTGLVGEIIRRGTNYLICVTKEDNMFKSWIRDVMEYTEVQMSSKTREKKKPNTLFGTSGYRKNAQDSVPGQKKIINFKEFINKYRKSI